MTLSTVSILGVDVTTNSKEDILLFIHQSMHAPGEEGRVVTITTPNPEQVILAQKDTAFKKLLNASDVALPDGVGIVWAMKRKGKSHQTSDIRHQTNLKADSSRLKAVSRISGSDFVNDICRLAVTNKWPIACYGGRSGVAQQAIGKLKDLFPGLSGWALDGPEITPGAEVIGDVMAVVDRMKKEGTRVVFIGFGAPKQELFMDALRKRLAKDVPSESMLLMAVGGSFDMIAGHVKRAPKCIQTIGLEWLWRLFQEPWRWRRQLALFEFVWLVLTK